MRTVLHACQVRLPHNRRVLQDFLQNAPSVPSLVNLRSPATALVEVVNQSTGKIRPETASAPCLRVLSTPETNRIPPLTVVACERYIFGRSGDFSCFQRLVVLPRSSRVRRSSVPISGANPLVSRVSPASAGPIPPPSRVCSRSGSTVSITLFARSLEASGLFPAVKLSDLS
jgi:hypothetical protein